MDMHSSKSAMAATMLALLLAGCAADKGGDCPTMTGVTDASVRTVFRPGATQDPANVLYTAEIARVTGACDIDKKSHTTDAGLTIDFRATRAANVAGANYVIPYFVAVTQGPRILARHSYAVTLSFAPGQTTAAATEKIGSAHVNMGADKHGYDYQVLAGLQLSRAELDYNRRTAHYQP
jgi:hypothetical protein